MPAATPAAAAPRLLDVSALPDHLDGLLPAAMALCGSRSDAEDLVQEVCAKVLAAPRVVQVDDRAYLLGVLRNTFRSQCRSRRRTVLVEPDHLLDVPETRRADPETTAFARAVHAGIAALPKGFRDVVLAIDVLGLSYAETAAALAVPAGTVMSRLSRGRDRVARGLGDDVIRRSSAAPPRRSSACLSCAP
jgi:RNA polymerase sigma-70 factor (ECF subfamily)